MKNILLIVSLIGLHMNLMAQSDPLRTNHKTSPQDSTKEEFKSNDSDDDAMELNHDRPADSKIIDTGDDKQAKPDSRQIISPEADPNLENGLSMRNGKVMSSENGTLRMLNKDTVLPNGLKIKANGTVITKDGSKFTMNEGQFIDASGNLFLTKDSIQRRKQ